MIERDAQPNRLQILKTSPEPKTPSALEEHPTPIDMQIYDPDVAMETFFGNFWFRLRDDFSEEDANKIYDAAEKEVRTIVKHIKSLPTKHHAHEYLEKISDPTEKSAQHRALLLGDNLKKMNSDESQFFFTVIRSFVLKRLNELE